VTLSFRLAGRSGSLSQPDGGERRWAAALVYGLLVPASLLAVAASGWYVTTGETPLDLLAEVTFAARIDEPMPPRPGPEKPAASLIQPPAQPPATAPAAAPQAAPQAAPTAAEAPKPAALPQAPAAEAHLPAAPHEQTPQAPADIHLPTAPQAAGEPAHTGEAAHSGEAAKTVSPAPAPAATTAAAAPPPPPPPGSDPIMPAAGDPLPQPSFAQLPAHESGPPLTPGPLPDLLRNSGYGALPIVAGGTEPRTAYARPFAADGKAGKVAIVVTGLGLSKDATAAAIAKLPPEICLSFSPYAGNLDALIKKARAGGHEVLLDLPLEPANFPLRDAGPLAILARHAASEAVDHLEAVLGKGNSYVGVAAFLHSPVTASENWQPTLQALKNRGLLFLGDGLVGVPDNFVPAAASVTLVADEVPFRTAIDSRLSRLTMAAERDGSALAYISAKPVSFERVLAWIATLGQHNLVLAPASAVVKSGV